MTTANVKSTRRLPVPSKISQTKVYDYIKKLEVDGLPRVRAYAEAIDPGIYDLTPTQMADKLDYFKANCPNFEEIREMVLAEQKDWALRRSGAVQDKAMTLLCNLLDKANQIATDPDADAKELNLAVTTLKSIMPAFTAVNGRANADVGPQVDKKARAGKFIN